ncbi:hypothetical protein [Lysinibacillus xylanilyticus]|uniref:hypothetical protein n=1 Tax=Lysinibacillus xylanilyticus TaxID=582475 RepID=UPI0036D8F605
MNQYLIDTEFATKSLFDIVTYELDQIAKLEIELKKSVDTSNRIMAEAFYVTDQDVDDLEAPGVYANRHGYATHLFEAYSIKGKIEKAYSTKDSSIRTLYGSILQIAKQGLSSVYGKRIQTAHSEPKSGEPIHNIILQGRNQSLHFEEGVFRNNVKDCFMNLQQAFGSDFDLTIVENKAKYVVLNVLGWRTYDDYLTTMQKLLP